MSTPRIGFIGLGLMGHGMAKNLVTTGFPHHVDFEPDERHRHGSTCDGGLARRTRAPRLIGSQPPGSKMSGTRQSGT